MRYFTGMAIAFVFILALFTGCVSEEQPVKESAGTPAVSDSKDHEYSVQIEGSEMKKLTIHQIATMWEINAQGLLDKIIAEYNLKNKYTPDSVLDDLRKEYKFSPAMVKEIAEKMKQETAAHQGAAQ